MDRGRDDRLQILNESKLGLHLTIQANCLRADGYAVSRYGAESGVWIREEVQSLLDERLWLAAGGVLLHICEAVKENEVEGPWEWSALKTNVEMQFILRCKITAARSGTR